MAMMVHKSPQEFLGVRKAGRCERSIMTNEKPLERGLGGKNDSSPDIPHPKTLLLTVSASRGQWC